MRLGIISDTHGHLPNEVFGIFEKVDHILHAGDVGDEDILLALEAVAPVTAVFGNTDGMALRARLPVVAEVVLDDFRITVTHGDQFGTPTAAALQRSYPDADIIIFGHTHEPLLEVVDRTVTVMNPGSAGAPRGGIPASVGIMELEPVIPPRARLVPLD